MAHTFTGLLRTLKSNTSSRESMLLSSCEGELNELMHQIDIMVENKRLEWEHHVQAMQLQCERKEKETTKLRETLEIRNQEVGQLQQRLEGQDEEKGKLISKYEEQLARLQSEMANVKKNYGKLQRNANRQTSDAERFQEQVAEERNRNNQETQRNKLKIQELEDKMRCLENANIMQINKLKGMEDQRKSLVEKSELMQEQLLGYQGQLTRKKQMLENLEEKHVTRLSELENEILQYKDEIQAQKENASSLKESLEHAKNGEERNWTDQIELKKEIQDLKRNEKILFDENKKMKNQNNVMETALKKRNGEVEALESQVQTLQRQLKKKEDEFRAADISKMQFSDESEVIRKLQRSINKYQHEIELKSVQGEVLSQKCKQNEKRVQELESECKQLQETLARKHAIGGKLNSSPSDYVKLQNIIHQNEGKQMAEISGMKQQVTSLTEDLHHRDIALADMSERATRMELELRDVTTKFDKKTAELQVSNAQLEALRLENRHLRETSMDEQLTSTADLRMFESHLTEMKSANARVVAQLEDENQCLQHELDSLKEDNIPITVEDVDSSKVSMQQRNDDMKRVSALQDQLQITIKNYEEKIEHLMEENQNLRSSINEDQLVGMTDVSLQEPNLSPASSLRGSSRQQTNANNAEEPDFSNLLDFLEDTNISSGRSSGRQSITTDFITEEKKREEELQNLLASRISDLERKTSATLKKYLS